MNHKKMNYEQEYAEYLQAHQAIGNGDMLIRAMERGDRLEQFEQQI